MEDVGDALRQLPAFSRNTAIATFVLSVSIHLGFISGYHFFWHTSYLWMFPPQIWRLVTAFLITGPQLGLLFDTYFLYMYMSQLEVANPRFPRKADLLWYLIFVGGTIVGLNELSGLKSSAFLHALTLALCYTVSQDQRGMKARFYFVTIPAQLTPYAMIAINLVMPNGVFAIPLQLTGLVAAHLYDFLSRLWPEFGGGPNLIKTPALLTRIVGTPQRVEDRGFGTAVRPGGPSTGKTTGASHGSGVLPDAWKTRGPGRRLG